MKYKKKPVVIEAVQFLKTNKSKNEIMDFMNVRHLALVFINNEAKLMIDTLGGTMRASEGDYIIKGVKGEFYPCKPDIFEETYERVE